ncbi:hypothetical protein GCM10027160_23780 [Streptomyces calidiresistens]|uniref:Uncharacterized protein n=1 Tax=Streptomyces calidiresistens TaxID=1485586 RepID=A0A7W3T5J8_9ACTN|nr:hypothetical protein [Streptomyces calidiresistens]MBB0231363.1 hypothetical protein [Streptomyces calidiresistens]
MDHCSPAAPAQPADDIGLNPTGRPRRSSAGTRRRKAKRNTTRRAGSESA